MAYQPGLLPARSWEKVMANLADHFGDNAEIVREDRNAIAAFLTAHAADRAREKRARKIAASLRPGDAPLRITETPYIRSKHRELPARLVTGNPKVRSLAQCNACHTGGARLLSGAGDRYPGIREVGGLTARGRAIRSSGWRPPAAPRTRGGLPAA